MTLPHPRIAVRRFVLAPLAEIASTFVDPTTGRMIANLLANLDRKPKLIAIDGWNGDRKAEVFDRLVEELPGFGISAADLGPPDEFHAADPFRAVTRDLERKAEILKASRWAVETLRVPWIVADYSLDFDILRASMTDPGRGEPGTQARTRLDAHLEWKRRINALSSIALPPTFVLVLPGDRDRKRRLGLTIPRSSGSTRTTPTPSSPRSWPLAGGSKGPEAGPASMGRTVSVASEDRNPGHPMTGCGTAAGLLRSGWAMRRESASRGAVEMKPRIFVGSSSEALDYAYAIHQNLEQDAEVTVWKDGLFELSGYRVPTLLNKLALTDFGVFVFSSDDVLILRGEQFAAVRDNVVFELGLSVGRLGIERNFVIIPRGNAPLRVLTDLEGLSLASFDPDRADDNLRAALGTACHQIRKLLAKLGPIPREAFPKDPHPARSPRTPARIRRPHRLGRSSWSPMTTFPKATCW